MNWKKSLLSLFAAAAFGIAGCNDNSPMYGRAETIAPHRIFFGDRDLQDSTRIAPIDARQDSSGILHIQLSIRSTTDSDQYVDSTITFTRNGQFVEKIGPQTQVLRGNVPDVILFNSTQPADDYTITLRNAK